MNKDDVNERACRDDSELPRDQRLVMPFIDWWEADDPGWVKKRQDDWEIIESNIQPPPPKAELRRYKAYFLTGEIDQYMSGEWQYFFTPYNSAEDARSFFFSEVFEPNQKKNIISNAYQWAATLGHGLDWQRVHVQNFVEGVLGKENRPMEFEYRGKSFTIEDAPASSVTYKLHRIIGFLSGEEEYITLLDCFDYFVSSVKQVNADNIDPDDIDYLNGMFAEVFELTDTLLLQGDAAENRVELAEKFKAHEVEIKATWLLKQAAN